MADTFHLRCGECGHQTPTLGHGFVSLVRGKEGETYMHGLGHPCELLEAKDLREDLAVAEREGRVWMGMACHCPECGKFGMKVEDYSIG